MEEIDFNNLPSESEGLSASDFGGGNFLKNPEVGESITFTVKKIVPNKNVDGKSKTGQAFKVGLKKKDGTYMRYDIETDKGLYTISNWEIFFKLLGGEHGLLLNYAKKNNGKFLGAKVTVKKNMNGGHMSTKINDLAKILNVSEAEAMVYQANIKRAQKESRLYEVKVE